MTGTKFSGIASIGEIPAHWKIYRIKSLLSLRSEKNSGDRDLLSVYLDRGVISYNDSDGMQVHKPSADLSNYQNVHIGDFVLNNQQAWRGSVGVSKYDGIISPAYFVFSLSDKCDPDYMNFLLRDGSMVQQYETASRGVGTIQRNLYALWFYESLVALPPLAEQRRIADFLDVNGLAIMSFELKCNAAGQSYQDAIYQYRVDRDPKTRLFWFKAGCLVNFAMDLEQVYMTTKLAGNATFFLPFNMGNGEGVNAGAGKPDLQRQVQRVLYVGGYSDKGYRP